jgi:branched-chain amino acid transport system substrate-binding protein
MKTRLATLALGAMLAAGPVMADLVFPSMSYRTGPFAAGGIPFADGYADYFTLLNERDGGIGGELISVPECETGYNTEKGVECYESLKPLNPLVLQPLSTGITYQLIPKVTADGIPLHTMGYGRTSAVNGKIFEWVFNYPGNYWDSASIMVKHALEMEGGSLEGKTIALVYHNSAYGKEPIRTLEELSKKYGFELTLLPVDTPDRSRSRSGCRSAGKSPISCFSGAGG